jgi:hypothetical protein
MTAASLPILYHHPDLGAVRAPAALVRALAPRSLPGLPVRQRSLGEFGIFVATQKRPVWEGCEHEPGEPHDTLRCSLRRMELLWHSITHNERVDVGAAIQANRLFGTPGTTANGVFTALAVANATFSKTKTDLSIGSASGGATTNEFTGSGFARAAATVSTYTAPASLGGQFSQLLSKLFTASGAGTAWGAAVFDSLTPAGSNLYVEDLFSSSAPFISGDTITVQATLSN